MGKQEGVKITATKTKALYNKQVDQKQVAKGSEIEEVKTPSCRKQNIFSYKKYLERNSETNPSRTEKFLGSFILPAMTSET